MNRPVNLAIFFRLHHPWYISPLTDSAMLPWVRLHGASTYSDLADALERHPAMRLSVSFSGSLLDQLKRYEKGMGDTYSELTLTPPGDLSAAERAFILRHFFSVHGGRHVLPLPRYRELYERRGREAPDGGWRELVDRFSDRDLGDLQLLFNLVWVGFSSADAPEVAGLTEQGRDFTDAQRAAVIRLHQRLVSTVVPRWSALAAHGQVDLLASAHYHPILPLLVDSDTARRATPEVHLPDRFAFPADAREQVARGVESMAEAFGQRPRGLWPPEAAISPETVQVARECGIHYLVADGRVLYHSLDEQGSVPGRRHLFQPYLVGDSALLFRHEALSRAMLREYAEWEDGEAAAADFLRRVREAAAGAKVLGDAPPLVVVALSAEKPWEAYPQRGRTFLNALFAGVVEAPDIRPVTLREHLASHPPQVGLDYLHSGSWTEGNFAMWIGDPHKNRAWNLLRRARLRLDRVFNTDAISRENYVQALEHLLRAEGSDWFWWLGEPFSSQEDELFETLFREHLAASYRVTGESPPVDLARPVEQSGIVEPQRQPSEYISPIIRGRRTAFFEWRGGGLFRLSVGDSVHYRQPLLTALHWGFDPGRMYLRLDMPEPPMGAIGRGGGGADHVRLEISGPGRQVTVQVALGDELEVRLMATLDTGQTEDLGPVKEAAHKEVLELAVPVSRMGFTEGDHLGLSIRFLRQGEDLGSVPHQGVIEVEVPSDGYEVGPSHRI